MFMPSIFGRTAMDDFFDNAFSGYQTSGLMKTDIKETDTAYELAIDLPGVKKEDVKAELKDGYLTVTATAKKAEENTSDKKEKYVQKERFHATCNRSFYVGDAITEEDVHAKYEDGILKLSVPKKEAKAVEQTKHIAIEG